MSRNISIRIGALFLYALFSVPALAANEVEYVLEKTITSFTPVFMAGHTGDPAWVEGFTGSGLIFLGGSQVGTLQAEVKLMNPPNDDLEKYAYMLIKVTNNIPGVGTWEVTGQGLALGSSTTPTAGDNVLAYAGSISNGTGALTGAYGLVAGTWVVNLNPLMPSGEGREVYRIRWGF